MGQTTQIGGMESSLEAAVIPSVIALLYNTLEVALSFAACSQLERNYRTFLSRIFTFSFESV